VELIRETKSGAAGFEPATKGFLIVPSEESQSEVLDERGIFPFFATSTMKGNSTFVP